MRAARWFGLAAEKGHHGAQALLGHLLFQGDGVPRQRGRGLMWLSVALSGAKGPKDAWIRELHAKDFAAASDEDREVAAVYFSARGKEPRTAQAPGVPLSGARGGANAPGLTPVAPPLRLSGSVAPLAAVPPSPPAQ